MIRNEKTKTAIATHEVKPLTREQIDMLAAGFLPLIQEYYRKVQSITQSENNVVEAA